MGIEQFLRLFDFFSVLLRAATLIFQTLVIGGIVFLAVVLRPAGPLADEPGKTMRRWIRRFALGLAGAEAGYLALDLLVLVASGGISLGEAIGAHFAMAAGLTIACALVIALGASGKRWQHGPALLLPAGLILVSSVMTSHSVARMDHRLLLGVMTGLHQGATAAWIGGLPFLVLLLSRASDAERAGRASRRFSTLAFGSVITLALAGLGLSAFYVRTWSGLYETAYGVMVMAKVVLLGCLLALGAVNFFGVRAAQAGQAGSLGRVRCFGEVEIGIGLTVLLAAASLTSQPPAVDLTVDRLSWGEIAARMTPQWPRFSTPSVHELPTTAYAASAANAGVSTVASPSTAQEIAWSEYNHHWAGLVVFVMGLLALGALNFYGVRAAQAGQAGSLGRVRCFGEVEIGIGLTVLLAAASLTSQPPAVDLTVDRLSWGEIAARMTPQWPRFSTPSVRELPTTAYAASNGTAESATAPAASAGVSTAGSTSSAQEIAWSEYNHHWAGLVVFVMGLLALLARTHHFPFARNWPLSFLALAAFLFFRADPEAWPLGPMGFWQSWLSPEDMQHRFFVLLIVAFAIFEWRVQTGRVHGLAPALVFPAVCALAGAALLTHSHSFGNVKEELLAELSHTPIALAGVLAGWSRWLELRLPSGDRAKPVLSWIWPVCFILVGAILLNYREA